jgi:hypothetical protein
MLDGSGGRPGSTERRACGKQAKKQQRRHPKRGRAQFGPAEASFNHSCIHGNFALL